VISTFQGLAVAALAILPGATYLFAFERVAGAFGVKLADRVIRFLAASAVFLAFLSGPLYLLYREYVISGRLLKGDVTFLWLWLWLFAVLYIVVPAGLGHLVGHGAVHGWRWAVWLTGSGAEPRAWERIWRRQPNAIVRVKLKSGAWVAGLYGANAMGVASYAGGFPEDGDIYLTRQLVVDPDSGALSRHDDETPILVERGLWIRCSEMDYMDIQEF
jgi:hypothetical protein